MSMVSRSVFSRTPEFITYPNTQSPQFNGLLLWVPVEGQIVRDVLTNTHLVPLSSDPATISALPPGFQGRSGVLTNAGNERYKITALAPWKIDKPLTLCGWVQHILAPVDNDVGFFGLSHNDAVSAPFVSAALATSSTDIMRFVTNDGGTIKFIDSTITPASGTTNWYCVTFKTNGDAELFFNNVSKASGNISGTIGYGSTAQLFLGETWDDQNRNPTALIWDVRLYNTVLAHSERAHIFDLPTRLDLYQTARRSWSTAAVAGAVGQPFPSRVKAMAHLLNR